MKASALTILVVDDEPQIRRLLRVILDAAGYAVDEAETGRQCITRVATHVPDGIVLDLGLPGVSGLEVLRQLREWTQVPVLVLSVLAKESDKVAALDSGGDDYLTKPFGAAELTARMRALLRRVRVEDQPAKLTFGDITIDLAAHLVWPLGVEVRLTAREYDFFRMLVLHRGKVVTQQQILRELWGPKSEANTHYLRVHMTHLRQKLEIDPHQPRHLKTECGIGYRLIEN